MAKIQVHNVNSNGEYASNNLVVSGKLNLDNYFNRIKYSKYGDYRLFKFNGLHPFTIQYYDNKTKFFINHLIRRVTGVNEPTKLMIPDRCLIFFNTTSALNLTTRSTTVNNKQFEIKFTHYIDNGKLRANEDYVGFMEYVPGGGSQGRDLYQYYSTHPV